jgi:Fe2+ or Zn2+ uptake regulation protein
MSIQEIADTEDFGYKPNTIYKTVKKFEKRGFVCAGLKEGRANTFFITSAGCAFLDSEME